MGPSQEHPLYEVTADMPAHAKIILLEPEEGWSPAYFEREMAQYARDRGARPRTVTQHPENMAARGLGASWAMGKTVERDPGPILVSSPHYPRDRVTLYE
jgi:hypothetical protein